MIGDDRLIELNSFICGDCMDYLPQFPDKYFELAIVDPPYGIGEDGSKNKTRGKQADFGNRGGGETQRATLRIITHIWEEISLRIKNFLTNLCECLKIR